MLTFAQRADAAQISIAEIAAIPKFMRPRVTCFECDRILIPHLGKKKVWHFHHGNGADCDAASGEGLLHSEAKQHLRRELQQLIDSNGNLFSYGVCRTCRVEVLIYLGPFKSGDTVVLEKRHGERLRPDVTIEREGRAILFFEVVSTNPCDDKKWAQVQEWGLPFAEVAADHLVCIDDRAKDWRHSTPLRFLRRLMIIETVECNPCRALREQAEEAERQRQLAAAAAEEERRLRAAAAESEAQRLAQQARDLHLEQQAATQQAVVPAYPNPVDPRWGSVGSVGVPPQPVVWYQQVCRGCGTPLPWDPMKPYCRPCWRRWSRGR